MQWIDLCSDLVESILASQGLFYKAFYMVCANSVDLDQTASQGAV